jgi:hypothetical protein
MNSSRGKDVVPSNVFRFAQALGIAKGGGGVGGEMEQVVLYQAGVGTEGLTPIGDLLGRKCLPVRMGIRQY